MWKMSKQTISSPGFRFPAYFVRGRSLPRLFILFFCLAWFLIACNPQVQQPVSVSTGASTTIKNTGSDTMVNLALAWAEAYMKDNPQVRISVTGGGSGTGLAALINGTVDIANASRAISAEELAEAKLNQLVPVVSVVAQDAIVVIVHPSNPVNSLTISQLSDIYSGKIANWQEVGGQDRPIVLLSRESNSGTYVYFLENVVRKGNKESELLFSPDTLLMPSSEGIGSEVRLNPNAIGYDGLGYVTQDMKMLGIAVELGGTVVLPSIQTVNDGSYPISRPLYMYTAGNPVESITAYLDWIRIDGQDQVAELGFVPIK